MADVITGHGEVKLGTLAGPLLIASPNHTDVITAGSTHSLLPAMCLLEQSIAQLMHWAFSPAQSTM